MRWRPTFLRWLGASQKTGWDWIELVLKLSVPITIAVLGSLLGRWNDTRQITIADNTERNAILSKYIDNMQNLILKENLNGKSERSGEASTIARTLTIVSLSQLSQLGDTKRRFVLQFLAEAGLIQRYNAKVNLGGADLVGANLSVAELNLSSTSLRGVNLSKARMSTINRIVAELADSDVAGLNLYSTDLSGVNLSKAKMSRINLIAANLDNAYLSGADLGEANLNGASLYGANLMWADMGNADLRLANLKGANLWGANLEGANLEEATWDNMTKWPDPKNARRTFGLGG